MMEVIEIMKYDPNWETEFEKAEKFYMEILKDIRPEIVHVGSTSVPGMWAKPILDIDIIVNNSQERNEVIRLLERVGYEHIGNLGVEGREAFDYSENNRLLTWMKHNLYVCLAGNEHLMNHLLLKKHLQHNSRSVKKYSELKRELSKKYPTDIDSYLCGKTDLIIEILRDEGMGPEDLENIKKINMKN